MFKNRENLIDDGKKIVDEFNKHRQQNATFQKAIFGLSEKPKHKFATVEPCYRKINF